jgi:cell wall-associated NlpC family hydrolase
MDNDVQVIPVKYAQESEKYSESQIRGTIINKAKTHLGTKYVWAGKKPGGFDCSGFTAYMMSQYGINVSPSSRHQGLQGEYCKISDAQTGDLVFFSKYGKGGRITHVALVVENTGQELFVIHACSRGIVVDNILNDKYWTPKILYARNVISPKSKAAPKADKNAKTTPAVAPATNPIENNPAANPAATDKI